MPGFYLEVRPACRCAHAGYGEHSAKADVAEFNGDHDHVGQRLVVGPAPIGAPRGRKADTVGLGVVIHELCTTEASGHLHIIVMTAQPEIAVEEEILPVAVGGDMLRE